MKTYAQFFIAGFYSGEPAEACGDRAVIRLDGRMSQLSQETIAEAECRRRGFVAWRLIKGPSLLRAKPITALKCADHWAASLADYPVADESDWSELEHEQEQEHWDSWGRRDWRKCVESALQTFAPEDADIYWADELIDATPDSDTVLDTLWSDCQGETYHESDGPNFHFERAAKSLDASLLSDAFSAALNGAPLLPLDQQWRREPYPWLGAEPAPLVAALSLSH